MTLKIQFDNDTDKQNIIAQNPSLFLIEEQHHFDGNFLVFSDVKPLDIQLQDLNNTTNMILLKQEGII